MEQKIWTITKKEGVFLGLVIFLYTCLAFYQLGGFQAPQTYYAMDEKTAPARYEVSETPASMKIYMPVNDSSKYIGLKVWASPNDTNWVSAFDTGDDDKDYTAAMIWYNYPLNCPENTRYIQIEKLKTANRLVVGEVAFYNAAGEVITATPRNEGTVLTLDEPETPTDYDRMNSAYFDESYFPSSALEMQDGLSVAEMDHPPVGRLIIGVGMSIFGRNPFGFRFMQALAGVLMLPVLYFFARALLRSSKWAGFVTLLLAFDFMHYAQTRIGTLDAFLVLFILSAYAFMYFFHISSRRRTRFIYLFLSGAAIGGAIGTKWSGLYAALGLCILYFTWFISDLVKKDKHIQRERWLESLWCVLCFVIVPVGIYMLSYIPYAATVENQSYFQALIGHQQTMLSYHSGSATHNAHPYSSKWWTWLLALNPVYYYHSENSFIFGAGNPIVWGMGVAGVLFALLHWWDKDTGLVIALGYFAQLVPWFFITRDTFLYHYFPMIPFLLLGIGFMFKRFEETLRLTKWKRSYYLLFLAVLAAAFVAAWPYIYGSSTTWENVLLTREILLAIAGVMLLLFLLLGFADFSVKRKNLKKEHEKNGGEE